MIEKVDENGCTVIDNTKGERWMRYYPNSDYGRNAITEEYPGIANEIIGEGKPWGNVPVINETITH